MNAIQRLTFILCTILTLALAPAAPAQADGSNITGLWEIQGTPEGAPGPAFTNLTRIARDGALLNLDPWFGAGLGQWEILGGGQYSISFTHYFLDAGTVGEVTVTATGELSNDKQLFHGEFLTEISVGGALVDSVSGSVEGTRQ